ncbi:MAG TPA: DUF1849 family protein [Geminicoccus sp.]|uniref:EipB family protein n=1 Tax=Geminicoccus sp. TaxID=2024832 RepID=UPI002E32B18F|nr:DUF1849 family protein [Geminicoccus sp.]HEX2529583.1 DUF1849 family protein [Geminicoccus sp.]
MGTGSAAIAALVAASFFAGSAGATELAPHRAVYRLSLAENNPGNVTAVRGGLVMEWKKACDGWTSNQRLAFQADQAEGAPFLYDVRFSSWESVDNDELRFSMRSFDDGKPYEEFRGEAVVPPEGGKGKAVFAIPSGESVDLPAGTLFPTQHIKTLIAAAERGEHFVSVPVFDGGGIDSLSNVSAVIGKQLPADGQKPVSWSIHLAYHNLSDVTEEPEFQLAFKLRADGITDDMTLDYGEFVLHGTLDRLEPLTVPDCR